jgi:small-conductance mechanosensitive channel
MFQKYGIDFSILWVWLLGPAAFAIVLVGLLFVRRIVLGWVARGMQARRSWIDAMLHALSPSLGVGIVVTAFAVGAAFEPIPSEWRRITDAITTAGTILALVVFADGLVRVWMHRGARRFPMLDESYGLVTGFVRGIVFGVGLLMFLQSIGISIGPILATLGIGSLAIALALQQTVRNTLSGLFLIIDRPVDVGDYVKLASGQEGWLMQLGWRSSKFRMMNDNIVIVPNSQLVDVILTNLRAAREGAISIEVPLNVAGGSNLEKVETVTKEVATEAMRAVEGGYTVFSPSVHFQTLSAGAIGMGVLLRIVRSSDIERVKHEFIKRVTDRFNREEIKLA